MNITPDAAIIPAGELQPTLFDAFVKFIDRPGRTTETYLMNLRQFAAWMAFRAIRRPEREDILAYRDYLLTEHDAIQLDPGSVTGWRYRTDSAGNRYTITCRPATVRQYLQSVRQFFTWTGACGLYPDIAAHIHPPKVCQELHRKDALQPADVAAIEDAIRAQALAKSTAAATAAKDTAGRMERATEQGKRLFAMYLLAVNGGLRCCELSRADVRDLATRGGRCVLFVHGKGHTEADTPKPLAPEVYEALRAYLDARSDRPTPSSPLFTATGNRSGGRRIAPTTISRMLKQALRQAGYDSERITAHSLRHTAGTAVKAITGDLYATQQYLRHSNPATTERYLHNDMEAQEAETARQLYAYYHGRSQENSLDNILQRMNPAQLQQLTAIAQAMARS